MTLRSHALPSRSLVAAWSLALSPLRRLAVSSLSFPRFSLRFPCPAVSGFVRMQNDHHAIVINLNRLGAAEL
jgi:hypothetical protein